MKKRKKMRGTVQKVIKPVLKDEKEKAQIHIDGAEELYREIRVENELKDESGSKSRLEEGAEIDVILEADADALKKPE
jgi:ribonucleotide reductase beta subunit family protein with ferritin-like domain